MKIFLAHFLSTIRMLPKQGSYLGLNILCLTIGLIVFLFSNLFVSYEKNHDHMFSKRDQIYTVGSIFSPTSGESIGEFPDVGAAYGPLLLSDAPPGKIVSVARAVHRIFDLKSSFNHTYLGIRFVDPSFFDLFEFDGVEGRSDFNMPEDGVVITESTAILLFNRINVVGEKLVLLKKHPVTVSAVIKDIARDSHLNSDFRPKYPLSVLMNIELLDRIEGGKLDVAYQNIGAATYVLLKKDVNQAWLDEFVSEVYESHTPKDERDYVEKLTVRPLIEANTIVWVSLGFPVLELLEFLGVLILLLAMANYTNLAKARNLGRFQEVALRKQFGAESLDIFLLFMMEGMILVVISMLLALSALEFLLPVFNSHFAKSLSLSYQENAIWFIAVIAVVGFFSGLVPALAMSKLNKLSILSVINQYQRSFTRSAIVWLQFTVSTFIISMVLIVASQNYHLNNLGGSFPKDGVLVLEKMNSIESDEYSRVKKRLVALPLVQHVSGSSRVPFHHVGGSADFYQPLDSHDNSELDSKPFEGSVPKGIKSKVKRIDVTIIDTAFLSVYDMDLLSGSNIIDTVNDSDGDAQLLPIILNKAAVDLFGFESEHIALGKEISCTADKLLSCEKNYVVIGVVANQYFRGVHSPITSQVFLLDNKSQRFISLRMAAGDRAAVLQRVKSLWAEEDVNAPIVINPLDTYFNYFYRIPAGINNILILFSLVALPLALLGLYGVTSYMARSRSREIGLRKVMGARDFDLVRLLAWDLSEPIIFALIVAWPLAMYVANFYLLFFPVAISFVWALVLVSALAVLAMAWAVITLTVYRLSQGYPIACLK